MTEVKACPHCGLQPRDTHSLKRAGICDGLRTGKLGLGEVGQTFVKAVDTKTGELVFYDADRKKRDDN